MRIRQGNDFIFLWAIERSGEPEDFSNAVNVRLHFKNFDCVGEVRSFQIVDGNIVRVEVSPEWASRLGAYRLILSYEFEDLSYSDGDQKCVVDVLAFNIVPKTSEADDVTEMAKTTDIMIGLRGSSAYEVWLKDNPDSTKEDYYNWLRQPATDAVSLIDDKIEHLDEVIDSSTENESERVSAEILRLQSENLRISAETERVENEGLRVNAESSRETAESLRVEAELLRQSSTQEAILNAESATENANTAAQNADDAREAIQDDLGLKLDKSSVKQVLGASTTDVMSQKAVTDEIAKRSGLIYEYVHSDNIEISGFTVDLATGTFTKALHGLSNGDELRTCLNQNTTTLFLKDVTFAEYIATASMIRYVVNATDDTFQLSKTSGGAAETLTAVTGTDLTKWHFEKRTRADSIGFEGINALSGNAKNIRVVVTGKIANNSTIGHLYFNIDDVVSDTKYIAYGGSGTATLRSTYTLLRADAFGTIEYDCTYNGNNLVIRKNLLMIREQNLTAYTENQLFYKNNTTYTLNRVLFDHYGFTNGLTIQIYKQ